MWKAHLNGSDFGNGKMIFANMPWNVANVTYSFDEFCLPE